MHGNAKKTLDDNLVFQTIVFFFCRYVPIKVSQENIHLLILEWAWVTHHYSSIQTSNKTWIGHGDLTFTCTRCVTTTKCHLLQALQECFFLKKKSAMVRNNYLEPSKVRLAEWVEKALFDVPPNSLRSQMWVPK